MRAVFLAIKERTFALRFAIQRLPHGFSGLRQFETALVDAPTFPQAEIALFRLETSVFAAEGDEDFAGW